VTDTSYKIQAATTEQRVDTIEGLVIDLQKGFKELDKANTKLDTSIRTLLKVGIGLWVAGMGLLTLLLQ